MDTSIYLCVCVCVYLSWFVLFLFFFAGGYCWRGWSALETVLLQLQPVSRSELGPGPGQVVDPLHKRLISSKERKKDRKTDRQTDRQTETDREGNASMLATADRQSISQSWQMAKRNSGPWMPQESLKNPSRIPPALHLSFSGRVIRKWLIIPHKEQSINQSKRNTRINKIGLIGMNVR